MLTSEFTDPCIAGDVPDVAPLAPVEHRKPLIELHGTHVVEVVLCRGEKARSPKPVTTT